MSVVEQFHLRGQHDQQSHAGGRRAVDTGGEIRRGNPDDFGTDRPITTHTPRQGGKSYTFDIVDADGYHHERFGVTDREGIWTEQQAQQAISGLADAWMLAPTGDQYRRDEPPRIEVMSAAAATAMLVDKGMTTYSAGMVVADVYAFTVTNDPDKIWFVAGDEQVSGKSWPRPEPNISEWMPSAQNVAPERYTAAHEYAHIRMIRGEDTKAQMSDAKGASLGTPWMSMSKYGRTDIVESHAETFAEIVMTGGSTTNQVAQIWDAEFGWTRDLDDMPIAAAAGDADELPWLIGEGRDGPIYVWEDGTIERPTTDELAVEVFHLQGQHDQQRHAGGRGRSSLTDIYGGSVGDEYESRPITTARGETFMIEAEVETADDGSDGSVSGVIIDEDGSTVGSFSREFDFERGVVDNSSLNINDNRRGEGIGTAFLEATEGDLENMGITRARVTATDVGQYAWAARGYRVLLNDRSKVIESWIPAAEAMIAAEPGEFTDIQRARVGAVAASWQAGDDIYGADLLAVSDRFKDVFLEGPSWKGGRDFAPPDRQRPWFDENQLELDLAAQLTVFHLQGEHDQQSHAGGRGSLTEREARMGPKVLNDDPDRFGDWSDLDLTDQKAVKAAATDFAARLTAERDDGIEYKVRWAIANSGSTTVAIDGYDDKGTQVAGMSRLLEHDRGVMRAASLDIEPRFQGQGIGTHLQEGFEDFAASIGMETVIVGATQVGAYAWARAGYDWLPHVSVGSIADELRVDAPDLADRFDRATGDYVFQQGGLPEFLPTPWEVAEAVGRDRMMEAIPAWGGIKRLRTRSLAASASESRQDRLDRVVAAYDEWWPRYPGAAEGAADSAAEDAWSELYNGTAELAVAVFHLQGQHDQQRHAGVNADGDTIAKVGKRIPSKRDADDVIAEWVAPEGEFKAAQALAAEKARNVPRPTQAQIDKNLAALEKAKTSGRAGGELRGNSYTRRARAEALFKEFGGDEKGYCPCGHCGIKVSPRGEGGHAVMQQDKILTASEGGTYGTPTDFPNLIPSCGGCNSSRNDEPYPVRPAWMVEEELPFAAAAGRPDEVIADVATGKPVGWDDPSLDADIEVSGEYVTRRANTWFGAYTQHLVGGETCDPETIEVEVDTSEMGLGIEVFHYSGQHNQQNHAGGGTRPIPPPPRRREGRPRPGGALPDVPFSDVRIAYRPRHPDGKADPGEVVWARVPFEEDITRSKDRPVLIIGRTADGEHLVGVQLTSKGGHDRVPVGTGEWDHQRRESYMDTDRFIQVDENNYRREGAYLKKPRFQEIVDVLTERQNAPDVDLAYLDTWFSQFAVSNRGLLDEWLAGRELSEAEAGELADWVQTEWLTGDEDVDEALTVVYTRLLETVTTGEEFHANHDQQTHGRRRNGPGAKLARWFRSEFQPSGEWNVSDVVLALFTLPARAAFPTDRRDPVLLAARLTVFHLQGQHDQDSHGNRAGGTATVASPAEAVAALNRGEAVNIAAADAPRILVEIGVMNGGVVDMTNLSIDGDDYVFSGVKAAGRRTRSEMPQIPEVRIDDFRAHLEEEGVTFAAEMVNPLDVRSTQTELDATKVGQMIARVQDGNYTMGHDPWVSSDGFILDGHHRWATMAVLEAAGQPHPPFNITRVSMPIDELLVVADEFNEIHDVQRKTIHMARVEVFHLQGEHDQQSHAGGGKADGWEDRRKYSQGTENETRAAKVFSGQFKVDGYSYDVETVTTRDEYGDVKVEGRIFDVDGGDGGTAGAEAGKFMRTVHKSGRVTNDVIIMNDDYQGAGIGTGFLDYTEQRLQAEFGTTEIELKAVETGRYAWAARGYGTYDTGAVEQWQDAARAAVRNGALGSDNANYRAFDAVMADWDARVDAIEAVYPGDLLTITPRFKRIFLEDDSPDWNAVRFLEPLTAAAGIMVFHAEHDQSTHGNRGGRLDIKGDKKLSQRKVLSAGKQVANDVAEFYGAVPGDVKIAEWETRSDQAGEVVADEYGELDGGVARFTRDGRLLLNEYTLERMGDPELGVDDYRKVAHEAVHGYVSGVAGGALPGISQTVEEGSAELLSLNYWNQRGQAYDERDATQVIDADGSRRWSDSPTESLAQSTVYGAEVVEVARRAASKVGWDDPAAVFAEVEAVMRQDHTGRLAWRDSTDGNFALPDGVDTGDPTTTSRNLVGILLAPRERRTELGVEQFHANHDQSTHGNRGGTAVAYDTPDGLAPPSAHQREYDPDSGLEPGQGLGSEARDHYLSQEGFEDFNQPLRFGTAGEGARHANRFMIDELTADIDSAPGFVRPTTLYRGLNGEDLGDVEVGTVITDPAFMSTTTTGHTAAGFADMAYAQGDYGERDVRTVLKIAAPIGTKAVRGRLDEDEWIVQRGSSLVVTSITRSEGRYPVVEIEAELRQG